MIQNWTWRNLVLSLIIVALFSAEASIFAQPKFVEISGKQQRILDRGEGEPAVVFVTGLGGDMRSFSKIQFEISKVTRTISYDRAGLGKSEPIESQRSIDNMVDELNEILRKENVPPPYLLVGHSLGGYILRLFVNYYPKKVAGLFFIDPASEGWQEARRAIRSQEERARYDSLLGNTVYSKMPEGMKREMQSSERNEELIKGVSVPNNIPVTLITSTRYSQHEIDGGETKEDIALWVELHRKMIENAPQTRHLFTDKSGHNIHSDEPELVVSEIQKMITLIRSGGNK